MIDIRIVFAGEFCPHNWDRGLRDLKTLMKKILNKWPDVQFISTDQLINLL